MAAGRAPSSAGFYEIAWSFGKAAPRRVSWTSRFLQLQGVTYFIVGLVFVFHPTLVAQLLHAKLAASSAPTLGMLRYAGMHIGTIGYWYVVTARSTASFFPPATVFLRLVWVGLLSNAVVSIQVFLAREGYIDNSLAVFSYGGDILLAVLTYLLWRAEGKP